MSYLQTPINSWFSLGIRPGVRFLGHVEVLFSAFSGSSIMSSIVAAPSYIPTNSTHTPQCLRQHYSQPGRGGKLTSIRRGTDKGDVV